MDKRKKRIGATDIVLAALALALLIGILTFLKPCGPKDDGSWMTCHWAGRAVTGVSAALFVMALVHIFVDDRVKQGLDIAAAVTAVLAIIIPGRLIDLCMMDTMRCRAVMTPGVIVLSVLTVAAAAVDYLILRKKV